MLEPKPRCWGKNSNRVEDSTAGLIEMCSHFIKPHMVGVEIGSFSGSSAEVFSHFCKHITCVDAWELAQDERGYRELPRESALAAEKNFDALLATRNNITKMKMFGDQAVYSFPDGSLDFVYIDAAHDPINAEADIRSWAPKIKKDGFMTGHDFNQVVNVLKKLRINVIKVYSDTSWIAVRNIF